ncbi:hypothetical protein D9M72_415310 [compost metagenome]
MLLDAGQAASRRRHGKRRGNLVVTYEPGDFLGEVFLGFEVVAPARRRDCPAGVVPGHGSAEVLERGDDLFVGEVDADPGCGECRRQLDGHGVRCRADVGAGLIGGAAGQLHQEVDHPLRGDAGNLPVHAAFETLGRFGGQLVPAA